MRESTDSRQRPSPVSSLSERQLNQISEQACMVTQARNCFGCITVKELFNAPGFSPLSVWIITIKSASQCLHINYWCIFYYPHYLSLSRMYNDFFIFLFFYHWDTVDIDLWLILSQYLVQVEIIEQNKPRYSPT